MSVVDDVLGGNIRVAARLMRDLDDRIPAAIATVADLYMRGGKAHIVGITGNPGAGKSTLVDALIRLYRQQGQRVAVVAIDPTSPFSGGAILGDRIRMQRHATDPGVFIRSLATRGQLGGLSRSSFDIVTVLDAMAFDVIFLETVGVGQDEVDVMRAVHTSVVVTVPGLGDDVQAIKAGLFEIADLLVINKADREGAERTERDLLHMLSLRSDARPSSIEVIRTIARAGVDSESGVPELAQALARCRGASDLSVLEKRRAEAYIVALIRGWHSDEFETRLQRSEAFNDTVTSVAQRKQDPYSAAHGFTAHPPRS